MERGYLICICLLMNIATILHGQTTARLPPSIFSTNSDPPPFNPAAEPDIDLKCEATGKPAPSYSWFKDGQLISYGTTYSKLPTFGNIRIKADSKAVAGSYYCKAWNDHGAALSRTVNIRNIVKKGFPTNQITNNVNKNSGQSLTLACNGKPKDNVPAPTIKWARKKDPGSEQKNWDEENGRKTIDADGNLHFTYLVKSDANEGTYKYFCVLAYNNVYEFGSPTKLTIYDVSKADVQATPMWSSLDVSNPVIGLRGESVNLKCIFAGKPNPTFVWQKKDGSLPAGRTDTSVNKARQVLRITRLEFGDQGTYQCQARQGGAFPVSTPVDIPLTIEAKPYWIKEMKNVNTTEGDDYVVHCDVNAVPTPHVQFKINGKNIESIPANSRRTLLKNENKLEFINLNRTTDLQVVQCVASNKHGVAMGSTYINILKRTKITTAPLGATVNKILNFQFNCSAEGDPSTPLEFTWYRGKTRLGQESGKFIITTTSDESKLTVTNEVSSEEYSGTYACHVTNGYTEERKEATLAYVIIAKQIPTVPPKPDTTWIYAVIAVAAILVIVIIVIVIVCKRRNQEIGYSVDSKERKAGHNPEKEIADSGFHDYNRPDEEPVGGSRASLTDSVKPLGDSDEDSMAEYGDIDTGKFNEDGSFIGLYADDKGTKKQKNSYQNNVADSQV